MTLLNWVAVIVVILTIAALVKRGRGYRGYFDDRRPR